jgi:hypothetical protein
MGATQSKQMFSQEVSIRAHVRARPEAVWALLTDAAGFPRWNSTVEQIEGPITVGTKLKIRVPSAPGQTFSPTVTVADAPRTMVWQDGFFPMFQGTRTFTLTPDGDGTLFEMHERFRGLMLPMIRGSLPDFGPIFERYAADLAAAAEG